VRDDLHRAAVTLLRWRPTLHSKPLPTAINPKIIPPNGPCDSTVVDHFRTIIGYAGRCRIANGVHTSGEAPTAGCMAVSG
jgi:hypothetical protein